MPQVPRDSPPAMTPARADADGADINTNTQVKSTLDNLCSINVSEIDGAYPTLNPVDLFRAHIADELAKLTGVNANDIFLGIGRTITLEKGDLYFPVPRLQKKGSSPVDQSKELAEAFPDSPLVLKPVADGTALRFWFRPDALRVLIIPCIQKLGASFGLNSQFGLKDPTDPSKGKKHIVIEFSSPNIAKEFHVGHLRSTIIGAFLSNLHESLGWDVTRLNYLGDWGRQYGLLAVAWDRYGSEETFQKDPIGHLFELYVRISAEFKPEQDAYKAARDRGEDTMTLENKGLLGAAKSYFKRMEDGNEAALKQWQRFRNISIEKYKVNYARLNIDFQVYSGESTVQSDIMMEAENILTKKSITEHDNGAIIIDFKKHGAKKLETAIVRNRNGTTTYMLRDIGAAIQRYRNYGFDRMTYVIMDEQNTHVQRFFKTLELMGGEYAEIATKLNHVTYGKVKGMSTRKGTVKFLGDVLNDVGGSMHEVMRKNETKYAQVGDPEKVADVLGISSILIQDMSGKKINGYEFDLNRMLSFEGDTGPYLQYAHARLCSIARKASILPEQLKRADLSLLVEKHAVDLLRLLAAWPDTLNQAYRTLEASTIVTYLFKMTHQLSSSYDVLKVVRAVEGPEMTLARAALYDSARQVIRNAMVILGLTPLERM